MQRKSLSDILHGNDDFFDGWENVQAADEFGPVPPGEYITHLIASEPFEARTKGTPGYKLVFKIIEGEFTGRRLWYDIWLTVGAKAQAKRDFAKLGITDPKRQLERPLPQGIRCKVKVTLRHDDGGAEYNRVKTFAVLGIDPPEQDAFAPPKALTLTLSRRERGPWNRNQKPPKDRQGAPMTTSDFRFGFRIVGGCFEARRVVDAAAALAGYAACDTRAEVNREAYLSAFQFGEDFRRLLLETGSTAGFAGPCWAPWLWFDLDSDELEYAHKDAAALAAFFVERYAVDPGELLLFFSGSKGFHFGLPTVLWTPPPSKNFHRTVRRFAEHVAELAAVTIDTGVYDKVRAFRAPNSRHAKTGLHKRRLTFDQLAGPLAAILELAKTPAPFDVPTPTRRSDQAAADWQAAVALVTQEGEAKAARRAAGNGSPTPSLNRSTLDFIREGAGQGDRHRLLFSAAANLGEFGCSLALAVALLEESSLDAGLPPKEVLRQVECGLAFAGSPTQQAASGSTQDASDGSTVKELPEAAVSESGGRDVQPCQQVTGMPAAGLQADLARLWGSTPAPRIDPAEAAPQSPALNGRSSPAVLPPLPTPLVPLPPGAVGSGPLEKPCRCGSTQYAELPIGEGRTRRDCHQCGRFVGFGRWYDQGGPTP